MKTTYINRYKDNIIFEQIDNKTIIMSGYNPEWVRIGYTNIYDDAYERFKTDNPLLNITFEDFKSNIFKDDSLRKYWELITTDYDNLSMIDPSGGPCIFIGSDLNNYFNENKNMIVKKITTNQEHAIFEI
jgi:hypothetical protein